MVPFERALVTSYRPSIVTVVVVVAGFSPLNRVADGDAKLLTYEQCINVTSKHAFATLKNSSMICASLDPGPRDICFVCAF